MAIQNHSFAKSTKVAVCRIPLVMGVELSFLNHKEELVVSKRACLDLASLTFYEFRLLCAIHEVSSAAYTNITSKTRRKTEGPGFSEMNTVRDKLPASNTTPHEFSAKIETV
jgi:hypothetical protein